MRRGGGDARVVCKTCLKRGGRMVGLRALPAPPGDSDPVSGMFSWTRTKPPRGWYCLSSRQERSVLFGMRLDVSAYFCRHACLMAFFRVFLGVHDAMNNPAAGDDLQVEMALAVFRKGKAEAERLGRPPKA